MLLQKFIFVKTISDRCRLIDLVIRAVIGVVVVYAAVAADAVLLSVIAVIGNG